HPASTTTGDPAVDRVVGMVRSGDLAALAESLHVQTVQCPAPFGIGEFPCPEGVPDGSLIEVIGTVDGCEGSYALAEDAAHVVEDWYSDAPWGQRVRVAEEPPDLYAAFRQGDSMAVVFAFESGVGAIAFVLPDGSVSLSPNVCEHWPANELVRNSDDLVRYLLPPVRPAPLTAYAPPLDPNVRTGDPQIDAIIDATMDGHVEDL